MLLRPFDPSDTEEVVQLWQLWGLTRPWNDPRRDIRRKLAMAEVERMLEERGCPKVNLQIRSDNEQALGFYRALGYAPEAAVSLGKRLIED